MIPPRAVPNEASDPTFVVEQRIAGLHSTPGIRHILANPPPMFFDPSATHDAAITKDYYTTAWRGVGTAANGIKLFNVLAKERITNSQDCAQFLAQYARLREAAAMVMLECLPCIRKLESLGIATGSQELQDHVMAIFLVYSAFVTYYVKSTVLVQQLFTETHPRCISTQPAWGTIHHFFALQARAGEEEREWKGMLAAGDYTGNVRHVLGRVNMTTEHLRTRQITPALTMFLQEHRLGLIRHTDGDGDGGQLYDSKTHFHTAMDAVRAAPIQASPNGDVIDADANRIIVTTMDGRQSTYPVA